VAIAAVLVPVGPAFGDPTIAEIEAQIDKSWKTLEPTIEQYNKTRVELAANEKRQRELEEALKPLQLQVDLALSRVGDLAAHAYKTGSSSSLAYVLSEGSAGSFLDQLSIMNQVSRKQMAEISNVSESQAQLLTEKRKLDEVVSKLKTQNDELAAKKKQIETDVTDLQKLRQKVYGAGGTGPLRPVACPYEYLGGAGGEAAKRACAQIGDPYVWGAGGPDSFDCSGLTMYAWGGSLSHSAAGQRGETSSILRSQLRPGDLIFYAYPKQAIHHVAIYVGGGWMVHAPTTGDHVRMAKIDEPGPVVGFGRPA
jgi:cell wall-associated NlpC family hydrolase